VAPPLASHGQLRRDLAIAARATSTCVRPGILLYGVYPSAEVRRTIPVRPALAWKSRVVYFRW